MHKGVARSGLEPDAHERAERTCPAEFRRHLILAAIPPNSPDRVVW